MGPGAGLGAGLGVGLGAGLGASLGAGHQVLLGEDHGDGVLLDRRRLVVHCKINVGLHDWRQAELRREKFK